MKVKYIFGVLALFCASIATADDSKISHGAVTVSAVNDEWTATNIKVVPGDILLTIEPGNKIVVGSYLGSTGADGLAQNKNFEGLQLTTGALQLKVGSGAAQRIGVKGFVIVNETGKVKLRVYDTNYQDNSGEFKVHIIRIPEGLIPPPEDVGTE